MKKLVKFLQKHLLDRDMYLGILTEVGFVSFLILCGFVICLFLQELVK